MNIFYLDRDTKTCAEMHVDKHVVKMILEYAQLLSTAHRMLDGTLSVGHSASGRKKTSYVLIDQRESVLYSATHINHPSAIWVRQSDANYAWLFQMFGALMDEYTYRYGKIHASGRLVDALSYKPKNISKGPFTEPTPAMPEECKVTGDSIASYRKYYLTNKVKIARWTNRNMPHWFSAGIYTLYEDVCYTKLKLNRIISMPLKYANIYISR